MKAIELNETFVEGYWVAGDIYAWLLRAPDKALASYDRALALNPNHADEVDGSCFTRRRNAP